MKEKIEKKAEKILSFWWFYSWYSTKKKVIYFGISENWSRFYHIITWYLLTHDNKEKKSQFKCRDVNWMFVVGHFDHFWLWCMQFLHWHTIICCDRMYWPGRKTSFFFWKESEVLCHAHNVTMTSLSSIDFCLSPAHRSIQSARKCIIIVWLIADVYAKSKEKKKIHIQFNMIL